MIRFYFWKDIEKKKMSTAYFGKNPGYKNTHHSQTIPSVQTNTNDETTKTTTNKTGYINEEATDCPQLDHILSHGVFPF